MEIIEEKRNHVCEFHDIHAYRHIPNIFNDGIAFVDCWDFSKANLNEENRIRAITQVASICYQSPKSLGSESLYNRLMAESMGLPSSSFEFVPVLLDPWKPEAKKLLEDDRSQVRKFGEWVEYTDSETGKKKEALLTNYRALYYDYENAIKWVRDFYAGKVDSPENAENFEQQEKYLKEQYLGFFNTEAECDIIKKHFYVFLYNVDFPTRSQMVRHRVNWQELSRRYVSGKRVPFNFYVSEGMKKVIWRKEIDIWFEKEDGSESETTTIIDQTTEKLINDCVEHYYVALEQGIKPQEARRIIPQAAYTQIWGAFQPTQLENFFRLRLDEHAQWEIRKVAEAMKKSVDAGYPKFEITPEREEELFKRLQDIANGDTKPLTKDELQDLLDSVENTDNQPTLDDAFDLLK